MELLNAQLRTITDAVKAGLLWARARLALIALISLGAFVPLWLREHDARLRRELELRQLRQQTAAQIADLRARATAALRDADSSAQRAKDLEARRRRLEREEGDLRSEISNLKAKEHARVQEIAALPFPALRARLQEQLGPEALVTRDSRLDTRDSEELRCQVPGVGCEGPHPKSETRHLEPASRIPSHEIALTDSGARAVEAALVERDACREQSQAKDELLGNCRGQAAASRAAIGEMARSLAGLKEAVRLKDEIQSRTEAAHRAELKAARGSRLRRFGRALQYVGAGVVIGVVVAQ